MEGGARLFTRELDAAYDRVEPTWARALCVPLATGIVVALVLCVLWPPFACTPARGVRAPELSAARVAAWAVVGAVLAAVLARAHVFRRLGTAPCA